MRLTWKLQLVQNTMVRLLTGVRQYQHISPTLTTLQWLLVCFCIDFKVLMITFKDLHGLGPRYLSEPLFPARTACIAHSSQAGELGFLIPKGAQKERTRNEAFPVVVPHLWNTLPSEIPLAPSLGISKHLLKT